MTAWSDLCAIVVWTDRSARRLVAIETIEAWLDLGLPRARETARAAICNAREVEPLFEALVAFVLPAQRRGLDVPDGPTMSERFAALWAAHAAGTLDPVQRRLLERNNIGAALIAEFDVHLPSSLPGATTTPEVEAVQARIAELQARQDRVLVHTTLGHQTITGLMEVTELIDAWQVLIDGLHADSVEAKTAGFFAGHAAAALARGRKQLGQMDKAREAALRSATFFKTAGEDGRAADSAAEAEALRFAIDVDIDGASIAGLRALVDGEIDSIVKAEAQCRLSQLARAANDLFDAAQRAEACATALAEAGCIDVAASTLGEALQSWVAVAAKRKQGDDALRLFQSIAQMQMAILQARHAIVIREDEPGAAQIAATMHRVAAAQRDAIAAVMRARDEVQRRLRPYLPHLDWKAAPDGTDDFTDRSKALLDRTSEMTREGEQAAAAGDADALSRLAEEIPSLIERARKLGDNTCVAWVMLCDSGIRFARNDCDGAIAASVSGERILVGGEDGTTRILAAHPSFDLLVQLRQKRLESHAGLGDDEGVLRCAEETVQLLEARRHRISDPYQQGAFLDGRTLFYELAALAAFKLDRLDSMLCSTELMKSRAALRNRLSPLPPLDASDISARLVAATRAMTAAAPNSVERGAAAEQRRLLLGMAAIVRSGDRGRPTPPDLTIAAVQAALSVDEAVVSWAWISATVIMILAIDATRAMAQRIVLTEAHRGLLDSYIRGLDPCPVRGAKLAQAVDTLCDVLLPPSIRTFVGAATRLILSPHRELHLVPFHAASIDGRFLIERAAVRYVPNLGSLLVPCTIATHGLFAMGIEHFETPGKAWKDLKGAEVEARDVAARWHHAGAPVEVLLGDQATEAAFEAVVPRLSDCRCLHFATHGTSVLARDAMDDPLATTLILRDAAVDAARISQLQLRCEVVVLAACHLGQRAISGRGLTSVPGDDVFGLQGAFFEAGAWGVIGALWPLDDTAGAALLPLVHDGLARGLAPDLALRNGVIAYLALPGSRREIFFWGALFLSAMGRPMPRVEN